MPYNPAPRCRHIKVNGTQCGSPALRDKNFCFYHQQNRPWNVECYSDGKYATGEIPLPYFEDAHSIQTVIRQVVQMVLQKRIERKTASLLLYALQIASSNLKRMEQEKPQPEQVVTDMGTESGTPIAAQQTSSEDSDETIGCNKNKEDRNNEKNDLPPGTIHACHQPEVRVVTALCPVTVGRATVTTRDRQQPDSHPTFSAMVMVNPSSSSKANSLMP